MDPRSSNINLYIIILSIKTHTFRDFSGNRFSYIRKRMQKTLKMYSRETTRLKGSELQPRSSSWWMLAFSSGAGWPLVFGGVVEFWEAEPTDPLKNWQFPNLTANHLPSTKILTASHWLQVSFPHPVHPASASVHSEVGSQRGAQHLMLRRTVLWST